MNRFYQPSLPRYTSQFIDTPLPAEMMFKAGEAKHQQQMQFAQDVAEVSSMTTINPPGYRTEELASGVNKKYEQKVDDFVSKYGDKYDSPQAMMELYKLHSDWARDPQVQLIKRDREEGDKQWNAMVAKTKTYNTDIKPGIDPRTGMLYQFGPNDTYRPHSPFVETEDWKGEVRKQLESIHPKVNHQEVPYTSVDPETGRVFHGVRKEQLEERSYDEIDKKLVDFTSEVVNGSTKSGLYLREKLKEENGRYLTPEETYVKLSTEFREPSHIMKSTGSLTSSPLSETGLEGSDINNQLNNIQTPLENRFPTNNNISNGTIRQLIGTDVGFGKYKNRNESINSDDTFKAIHNNLENAIGKTDNLTDREYKSKLKDYRDGINNQKITYGVDRYTNDKTQKTANQSLYGQSNPGGVVKGQGSTTLLEGQPVYNLTDGKVVQNIKDKRSLVKDKATVNALGPSDYQDIAKYPSPGILPFESNASGEMKQYGVEMPGLAEKQKAWWNLFGYVREPLSGIGPISVLEFPSSNKAEWHDVSDAGTNGNDFNVQETTGNGLYIVPVKDSRDGDVHIKVFAANPKDPNRTHDEKLVKSKTGIVDNDSPLFVREYKLRDNQTSDGRNPMENVYTKMMKEWNDMLNIKEQRIHNAINNQ